MLTLVALAVLQNPVWVRSPEEGRRQAEKTGKPILLVTIDPPGG